MLKAVACHTDQKWVLLYGERWLKAPMLMPDGTTLLAVEPWTPLAWKGHADDALVITGVFVAVEAMTRDQRLLSVLGRAIAFAGKPTAVALLTVAAPQPWLLAAYATNMLAIYAPFLVTDPVGFLGAGRGIMPVGHDSLPILLGYDQGSPLPVWVRPVQLVLAPLHRTNGSCILN